MAFCAFLGFDLLPIFQDCGGIFCFGVTEDVRVAAHHFRVDGFDYVGDGERAGFFGEDRVEHDLEKQVTQFGGKFSRVVRGVHRVEDLVGFFDQKFAQGLVGLLVVPGTAVRAAQARL